MFQISSHSRAGGPAGERSNEDYVLSSRHPGSQNVWVGFLADGAGSSPDGGTAARIACEIALENAFAAATHDLFEEATWTEILEAVDKAVAEGTDGLTTLIGFAAGPTGICGASCGESKLISFSGTKVLELTKGQPKKPLVGAGAKFRSFSGEIESEMTILSLSDGAWKQATQGILRECAASDDLYALPELLETKVTEKQGGTLPDDFSVIAVRSA